MTATATTKQCIGIGSYGEVHKLAHDEHGFVAVKYPTGKHEDEYSALTILKARPHVNVVRVYDLALEPTPQFVMELCDMDLYMCLEKHGVMSEQELRPIAKQVIAGMLHCIKHNIFHGDLKAENVLLKNGVVKLADFGLCSFTRRVVTKTTMTPQYAAPELVCTPRLKGIDVEQVDVWSFGIMLAICATGFLPMEVESSMRVCKRYQGFIDMCARGEHAKAVAVIVLSDTGNQFSAEFHSLIQACLQPVFAVRPRFEELATHPWLMNGPSSA